MNKRSRGDWIFDICLYVLLALLAALFLYPFWTVIAMSLNAASDTARGGIILWPRQFSLENYVTVFQNQNLMNSYLITISRTLIGTVASVAFTGMFAYAVSKKKLMFRRLYLMLCIITLYFGGGFIASTINMIRLGLQNNFLVYILPGLYSVMNILIMKSFFLALPASLEEAALIDGANDIVVFFRVVVPSSMPVIATIALMNAVGQWNAWFDAYIFVTNEALMPVQLILQRIVLASNAKAQLTQLVSTEIVTSRLVTPYSIQLATLVIAIGPIVFIYPFFQRYFIKGFLIGAVKE